MGFVSLLETIFKCPRTGQDLVLEKSNSNDLQQNAIFVSVDKNNKYPIINGVPRFVPKINYSESLVCNGIYLKKPNWTVNQV